MPLEAGRRDGSEVSLSSVAEGLGLPKGGLIGGGIWGGKKRNGASVTSSSLCCRCHPNPEQKSGRRLQLLQMLAFPFVPILALIIQNALVLRNIVNNRHEVMEVDRQVTAATELGKLVTYMQLERYEVAIWIFTNGTGRPPRSTLDTRFTFTDESLEKMTTWPQVNDSSSFFSSKLKFKKSLEDFRHLAVIEEEKTVVEVMRFYNRVNAAMLDILTNQIKETDAFGVWRYLIAFKNIIRSIENIGMSMVDGIYYYARGHLKPANYINYVRHDVLGSDLLNSSLKFVPSIQRRYDTDQDAMTRFKTVVERRVEILKNDRVKGNIPDAYVYLRLMEGYMNDLRVLQSAIRSDISNIVAATLEEASSREAEGIAILVLVLVVSPIIIIFVRNAVATIQIYAASLVAKARELKVEKEKSDTLLCQMLPPSVARQLRQTQQVPAEYYESVTVYFSDIVGFTRIAAESTPLEVVTFLNSIYKLFDSRLGHYDVYKVETIGDSYMVASGLPVKNGNKHLSEIATLALDLLAGSTEFPIPHRPGCKLQIRSGIHTGPVVAGIVGSKMPRYCLFGDTVNTASRMETTGEPLRIHLSKEMKLSLDDVGGFLTEPHGLVDVKGKGLLETFWLLGKVGGMPRAVELDAPDFFADVQPVFIRSLRRDLKKAKQTPAKTNN